MNRLTLLLIALLIGVAATAQTAYAPETLEKIREFENNVTGPVLLNNEKPPTLEERMAKYRCYLEAKQTPKKENKISYV